MLRDPFRRLNSMLQALLQRVRPPTTKMLRDPSRAADFSKEPYATSREEEPLDNMNAC
jgi:hypothetical protein